jgi:hypothetical protein
MAKRPLARMRQKMINKSTNTTPPFILGNYGATGELIVLRVHVSQYNPEKC